MIMNAKQIIIVHILLSSLGLRNAEGENTHLSTPNSQQIDNCKALLRSRLDPIGQSAYTNMMNCVDDGAHTYAECYNNFITPEISRILNLYIGRAIDAVYLKYSLGIESCT
ncbi:MAG: hypothetical protein MHMPM18_003789 [Marteilia pararefringens]